VLKPFKNFLTFNAADGSREGLPPRCRYRLATVGAYGLPVPAGSGVQFGKAGI